MHQSACSSSNFLVRTVFPSVFLSSHNFIGHNLTFGKSFVQDYSNICLDSVNLVRELRENSELNLFVHVVTILF